MLRLVSERLRNGLTAKGTNREMEIHLLSADVPTAFGHSSSLSWVDLAPFLIYVSRGGSASIPSREFPKQPCFRAALAQSKLQCGRANSPDTLKLKRGFGELHQRVQRVIQRC